MAETITESHGTAKWLWHSIMADLRDKGELDGVNIDPLSTHPHSVGGSYQDCRLAITWIKDVFMLLTVDKFHQELVDAFSKVLEYEPLCIYEDEHGLTTIEWDRQNPDARFAELTSLGCRNLRRLDNASA